MLVLKEHHSTDVQVKPLMVSVAVKPITLMQHHQLLRVVIKDLDVHVILVDVVPLLNVVP
tara:strand:- start:49 stop:228 length:180 start_codon:yes stop_codon:yes gene_type:complete